MSEHRFFRFLRPITILLLTLALTFTIQAQETNLLVNPGFEGTYSPFGGDSNRLVANGWTPWSAARLSGMPSFQNVPPRYLPASGASAQGIFPRIRSGTNAQIYYSFFETHDGGVYQRISGITPGTELRFSVYAHIWSSTFDDVNVSENPGGVALRVGIDPAGGTDGTSSSVIYSTPAVFYDTFRQYSVIATATSSTVTVFIRTSFGEPVQYTNIYLDDAVLSTTTENIPPTNTSVPPTNTPTATNTPIAPANTAVVAATNTPATVPSTTPTEAGGSVQDPTPTQESSDGVVPTATSIGAPVATATPAPSTGGPITSPPISDAFPGTLIHMVRRGDSVGALASLYGSSNQAIIEANGLDNNALIFVGQSLVIPVRLIPLTATPSATPEVIIVTATPNFGTGGPVSNIYIVQPGDTLNIIARRFSTTTATLVQLNGIANPNRIFIGQRITLPISGDTTPPPVAQPTPVPVQPRTYIVQPGDNLYRISLRFGVPLQSLANANGISNFNFIFVGQTLVIPA